MPSAYIVPMTVFAYTLSVVLVLLLPCLVARMQRWCCVGALAAGAALIVLLALGFSMTDIAEAWLHRP